MVHVGGAIRETLTVLSPCLSVAAAVVMGTGIAVHRRCDAARSAETRTVGTALAIFGGMLMLGALVLAWPDPLLLMTVSLVMTVAFASLAYVVRQPIFHALALVAATFALLVGFLKLSIPLPSDVELTGRHLVDALTMGRSALALTTAASSGDWRRGLVAASAVGAVGGNLRPDLSRSGLRGGVYRVVCRLLDGP